MSAREIVRCLAGRTVRCCVALAFGLLLVAPVLAQEPDGPIDDPYVKVPYTRVTKAPSTSGEKSGGGAPDSVTINVLDPSGFPQICTYVTVTHNGETVEGLDADSFCVSQDGIGIDSFTVIEQTGDSCITRICLVIDYSGSMDDNGKMVAAREAARRFIRQMGALDRMAVVTFANCWVVRQGFTSDTTLLLSAVNALTNPSGRTAALDGIWKGLDLTKLETGTNKAVIALSDGMENWSQNCGSGLPDGLTDGAGFADDLAFIDSISAAIGTPVYTISLGSDFDPSYLEDIANATGGQYHHAPTNDTLDAIYDAIKISICTRYLICYTSPDTLADGDCHTVEICRDDPAGAGDCFVCDTAEYCEPYPPVIDITVDPACRRWGQPVDLCATVTDSDTPPESLTVWLYYRIYEPGGAFAQVSPTRNGSVWCYTVPAASIPCSTDSIEFYFTATDGNSAVASPFDAPAASHQVTICQNTPPTCEFGPDLAPPVCNPNSPIDFVPLNLSDIDGNLDTCLIFGDGQLVSGGWQYDNPVPGDTAFAYIVCFDSCGDSCWIEIERAYPEREVIPCNIPDGGDTAFFLCDPGLVSFPVSGGEGSGCVILEGAGALVNGNWEYNATKDTSITFTVECIGLCDSCRSTFTVAINVNEPPVCGASAGPTSNSNVPCDTTIFLCDPARVCVPFAATDPDGNLDSCRIISGPGILENGFWCFEATTTQSYFVTILCVDSCGEVCERTVCATVVIDDVPVITCPNPVTFECDSIGEFPMPTVVDNGYAPATVSELKRDSIPGQCPQSYGWLITWVATDTCGHADTCEQRIGIVDTTAPSIICPDTLVFECDSVPDIDSLPKPTVVDNCDDEVRLERFIASSTNSECPQGSHMTITWVATDDCGNKDSCTQVINVVDTTAPLLVDCDTLIVIACDSFYTKESQSGLLPKLPTATDNCDPDAQVFWRYLGSSGRWPCDYTERVAIWAMDDCGNISDTCYQTLMLVDTVAPTIVCPDSLIFECPIQPTLVPPQATDNCSVPTVDIIGYRTEDSTCPGVYRWIIIWEATDYCGLKDTCEQVIRFQDTTPPSFAQGCPPLYYECDEVPAEFPKPPATDLCDPLVDVNFLGASDTTEGDCPQRFYFVLNWEAVDDCGNADTCRQVVYVLDTTGPVITCPNDTVLACQDIPPGALEALASQTGAIKIPIAPFPFGMPSAVDNCDPNPEIYRFVAAETGTFPCAKFFVIGYFAIDSCGNYSDTCFQNASIVDTIGPVVTCPPDTTISCDELTTKGTLEYLRSATKESEWGVKGGVISCPFPGYEYQFGLPTATDNCDPDPFVCLVAINIDGSNPCSLVVRLGFGAMDTCYSISDSLCWQTITVVDTTPPVVTCPPDTTVECDFIFNSLSPGQKLSPPEWPYGMATATDNCGTPTVDGPTFTGYNWFDSCGYQMIIRFIATDACGLADTCFQLVTITDTTAPAIDCPAPARIACNALWDGVFDGDSLGWPTAVDVCDSTPEIYLTGYTQIGEECPYIIRRAFVAVDSCGNVSDTCFQDITVYDENRPQIVCPQEQFFECDVDTTLFAWPTASDSCDAEPRVELILYLKDQIGPCSYVLVRAWHAVDECGNFSDTCRQVITVGDTTKPVVTCPDDTVLACQDIPPTFVDAVKSVPIGEYPFGTPSATDNCDTTLQVYWTIRSEDGVFPCNKHFQISYWTVDDCGNISDTCFQDVRIVDTIGPQITCPSDTVVDCTSRLGVEDDKSYLATFTSGLASKDAQGCYEYDFRFGIPSATDNCTDDYRYCLWGVSGPEVDSCRVTYTLYFTAFDGCQLMSDTCSQRVTFVDTTAPVVDCADDTTVYCVGNELPPCFGDAKSGKSGEKFLCDFRLIDTVYDACDPFIEYEYSLFYQTVECPRYIRATIWATDDCGNVSDTCYWTVYFADTTAPVIACPSDINAECGTDPGDWGWPTATDDCGEPVLALLDIDTVAETSCYLEVVRRFTATDFCGNADTCRQLIVIGDSTDPVITCPNDTVVDCADPTAAAGRELLAGWIPLPPKGRVNGLCELDYNFVFGRPSATDNCTSEPHICLVDVAQTHADSCRTEYTLTFVATDDCGNTDTCTQTVTFIDKGRPVLVCAPDTTIYCDRDKANCIELKGTEPFKLGDDKFLCGFRMVDTVYDACCEDVEVFVRLTYHLNQCPAYVRAFMWAVDCCGNYSDTCDWRLNIADTSAPAIVCPPDLNYQCDDVQGDWGWPTAQDNCEGPVTITLVDQDTTGQGCQTVITRTFSAKDRCNLESRCIQTITIADTTAPVCRVPNDTTIFVCGPGQLICLPVSATDNCDAAVECVVHDGIGVVTNGQWCYTPTAAGTHTVYIRCTDDCGNFCVSDFTVTFAFNSAPTCHVPNDTTIYLCDPTHLQFTLRTFDVDGNIMIASAGLYGTDKDAEESFGFDSAVVTFGFTPQKDTTICMFINATDSCGESCADTFCVTIDITEPPVCYQTPDTSVSLCAPQEVCIQYDWLDDQVGGTKSSDVASAPRGGKGKYGTVPQVPTPQNQPAPLKTLLADCQIISGPGELKGDYWCWTPPANDTTVTVLVQCADSCGHTCQNEFTVRFDMNEAPVCREIADTSVFLCLPEPVCVAVGASDTEGDSVVCDVVSGPGSVAEGQWCFTPESDGVYDVTIRCTDTCGAWCEESFRLTVALNDPPVCQLPNDTTIFICDTQTICLPVGASDPNGNFNYCGLDNSKGTGSGSVQNGQWCYFASDDAQITVPIACYDSCGAYCRGSFTVTVVRNDPPVCQLPNDTTIFLCEPGTVCLPVGATDANGNFSHCAIDETKGLGGYIQNGQWCIDVTDDFQSNIYIVCYDSCGAVCRGQFLVTIIVNDPPVCTELADTSVFLCEPSVVCRSVGASDANGNLSDCQVVSGPGSVSQGQWCFTPEQSGVYSVTIRCTDSCGAYCDESFALTVELNDPPVCVTPPTDTTIFLCEPTTVCIGGWGATDPDGNLDNCIILDDDKTIAGTPGGGLEWCDFIAADHTVLLTLVCTDSCGAQCRQDVFIHFVMNQPPVINLGNDISTQVGQGEVCFNYTVADPDNTLPLEELLLQFPAGAVIDTAANTICWTPEEGGLFMFVGKVIDSCNAEDVDTAFVIVAEPQPPICNIPGDTTVFQCVAAQINLPVSAVSQNPPVSCVVTSGPGSVSSGFWRFTPPGPGVYDVTIRCTDNLGQFCQDEFTVTVGINQPPVCSAPADTLFCLCPNQSASLTLHGFDPDGNITGYQLLSGPGSITGNVWSHQPLSEDEFTIRWRVVDACGRADTCQTRVRIDFNDGPAFSVRDDTTITLCGAGPVCVPLRISDQNNNITSVQVTSGAGYIEPTGPTSWTWCINPDTNGTYRVTVTVTDACGRTAQRTFNVTIIIIDAPLCDLPPSGAYLFCQSPVCIPIAGNNPPPQRGVTCTILDGPGYISGGNWCVNISGTQTFTVVIRCTNTCGGQCQILRTYTFTVDPNDCSGAASVGATYPGPLAGDVDGSGELNVADVALLTMLVHQSNIKGKAAAQDVSAAAAGYQYRADVNCDGRIDRADLVYLTAYIFSAGPKPCDPDE